jgi:hypothetical protein
MCSTTFAAVRPRRGLSPPAPRVARAYTLVLLFHVL